MSRALRPISLKIQKKPNFFALFRLHELSSAIITSHQGTRALDALEAMSGSAAKRTRGQPGKVSGLQELNFAIFAQFNQNCAVDYDEID